MAAKAKKLTRRSGSVLSTSTSTSTSGRMTAEQRTLLRKLAHDGYEPDAFKEQLTQAEAAKRIDMLRAKLPLLDEPPHTL
jgi:hypothetical protein